MEESFDYRENLDENLDQEIDKVLRPKYLADFSGQPAIVENLEVFIQAAKLRKEYMYWGFKAPLLHYAYEMAVELRLLAKRVSRLPKKINSLLN